MTDWREHDRLLELMQEATGGARASGWGDGPLSFAIIKVDHVREQWHIVVNDVTLKRMAALWLLDNPLAMRVNADNGVLIICPAQ